MEKTPEQIAAGLNPVQKRSIANRVAWGEATMGGYGADCDCPGLIETKGFHHPIFGAHYRLTPLGIEVAAILQAQENTNAD